MRNVFVINYVVVLWFVEGKMFKIIFFFLEKKRNLAKKEIVVGGFEPLIFF